jgi:hypothetical protein
VREELAELDDDLRVARDIREDQKSHALLSALHQGFERMHQDIRKTEAEQRRQRQDTLAVKDEIEARRDALIAALQRGLHRASRIQSLFVRRWSVV